MTEKSIELYLADGTPGGVTTAEISGWSGRIAAAPRRKYAQLFRVNEGLTSGVYLLLGEDSEALESTWCYIGRTEDFSSRLRDHDSKKPQWQRVVTISSSQSSFNEGHWGYMEARLLNLAKQAQRCTLSENKNTPQGRKLSLAQKAGVEAFIEHVKLVLPVLGVDILRSAHDSEPASGTAESNSPEFTISRPRRGINARLKVVDDEFFLLKGSTVTASCNLKGRAPATLRTVAKIIARHSALIDDGSFVIEGSSAMVTRDVPFTSPSAASDVVLGASTNGRKEWINEAGKSYGQWESEQN